MDAKAEAAIAKIVRERDKLAAEVESLNAKLAADPGAVAELERQLKAARTEARNAKASSRRAWEAVNAHPTAINKRDWRKLHKVIAVDTGAHATERQRTEAAQIFNALKLNVVDDGA